MNKEDAPTTLIDTIEEVARLQEPLVPMQKEKSPTTSSTLSALSTMSYSLPQCTSAMWDSPKQQQLHQDLQRLQAQQEQQMALARTEWEAEAAKEAARAAAANGPPVTYASKSGTLKFNRRRHHREENGGQHRGSNGHQFEGAVTVESPQGGVHLHHHQQQQHHHRLSHKQQQQIQAGKGIMLSNGNLHYLNGVNGGAGVRPGKHAQILQPVQQTLLKIDLSNYHANGGPGGLIPHAALIANGGRTYALRHHPDAGTLIKNGRLDLSQGSCDTTPATPDSLIASSLVCSAEEEDHSGASSATNQPLLLHHVPIGAPPNGHLIPTSSSAGSVSFPSTLTPPSIIATPSPCSPSPAGVASSESYHSNNNNDTNCNSSDIWRPASNMSTQQRDNLIEEITTPVPRATALEDVTSSSSPTSSSSEPSSPTSSIDVGGLHSASSPGSISPPRRAFSKNPMNGFSGANGLFNGSSRGQQAPGGHPIYSTLLESKNGVRDGDLSSDTTEDSSGRQMPASKVVDDMINATGTMKKKRKHHQRGINSSSQQQQNNLQQPKPQIQQEPVQQQHTTPKQQQKIYAPLYPQIEPPAYCLATSTMSSSQETLKRAGPITNNNQVSSCSVTSVGSSATLPSVHRSTAASITNDTAHSTSTFNSDRVVTFQPMQQHHYATVQRTSCKNRERQAQIAARINANLTSNRLYSTKSQDQLPLSNVRELAKSNSVSNGKIPSSLSNNDLVLVHVDETHREAATLPLPDLRLSEKKKDEPQVVPDEDTDEDHSEEEEEEEESEAVVDDVTDEKVPNAFPSILKQRPVRKPPFTIEGAMKAIKRRKSSSEKRNNNEMDANKKSLEENPEPAQQTSSMAHRNSISSSINLLRQTLSRNNNSKMSSSPVNIQPNGSLPQGGSERQHLAAEAKFRLESDGCGDNKVSVARREGEKAPNLGRRSGQKAPAPLPPPPAKDKAQKATNNNNNTQQAEDEIKVDENHIKVMSKEVVNVSNTFGEKFQLSESGFFLIVGITNNFIKWIDSGNLLLNGRRELSHFKNLFLVLQKITKNVENAEFRNL